MVLHTCFLQGVQYHYYFGVNLRVIIMQPSITKKEKIILVGMAFYGDPFETSAGWTEENQIGRLWQRLMGHLAENPDSIQQRATTNTSYEVHVYNAETKTKGFFEVFVGVPVEGLKAVPVDLLVKILPATQYAVFTLRGEQISSDWHLEINRWLLKTGYRQALPFSFQYYDERFKGLDQIEDSILDVYIPIAPHIQKT
jgi:predicted transcriptional regulator YdeE